MTTTKSCQKTTTLAGQQPSLNSSQGQSFSQVDQTSRSRSQGQILWYHVKGIGTRNTHVQYESSITSGLKALWPRLKFLFTHHMPTETPTVGLWHKLPGHLSQLAKKGDYQIDGNTRSTETITHLDGQPDRSAWSDPYKLLCSAQVTTLETDQMNGDRPDELYVYSPRCCAVSVPAGIWRSCDRPETTWRWPPTQTHQPWSHYRCCIAHSNSCCL